MLVLVGLYVRLTITETPVFREAVARRERVKVPMLVVFRDHPRTLLLGTLVSLATFVLFYLMTVFALSWGTTALGYSREQFLLMQLFGVLFFALTIPISAMLAERGPPPDADRRHGRDRGVRSGDGAAVRRRHGRRRGDDGVGLALMGLTYGPLGTVCPMFSGGALHRQLADVQPRRDLRRLAGAVHRHLAGDPLRVAVRRLLPARRGRHSSVAGLLATRETKDETL